MLMNTVNFNGIPICNEATTITCPESSRCIGFEYVCDGQKNCVYGTYDDEYNCSSDANNCTGFRCIDGRCMPIEVRCNFIAECVGAEDEMNCGTLTL
ncbi:G-protein coupled receptor GRL101-like protein [Leptotrombidium deliense]|uniref:G-protein coupled receptor GRL101-like protein n=1 Tax=Leptotrombidium deliense TaxID=299467 RepID=A0A443S5G0_9ACAR|nr:G-protein coupled receptor GRL101-like protein [Leptotrombidium deliense]